MPGITMVPWSPRAGVGDRRRREQRPVAVLADDLDRFLAQLRREVDEIIDPVTPC